MIESYSGLLPDQGLEIILPDQGFEKKKRNCDWQHNSEIPYLSHLLLPFPKPKCT